MKRKVYLLISALALAVFGYFMAGVTFLFAVFGLIAYAVYRNTPGPDRRFVLTVLVTGFLLRVVLAVALHAYFYTKGFHSTSGDDLLYIVKSCALSYRWQGKPYEWEQAITGSTYQYGLTPFTYMMAFFYRVFGFHPVASKIINCMIGALTGWVSYLMAARMFNNRAARLAIVAVTFYPSLVRWSAANLKDPMIILLFMICIYIIVDALCGRIALWKVLILAAAMTVLYFFSQIFYFALAVGGLAIALTIRAYCFINMKKAGKICGAVALVLLVAIVPRFINFGRGLLIDAIYLCHDTQSAVSSSDYAGYFFYPGDFMVKLSRGVIDISRLVSVIFINTAYFMLAPFPWQVTSRVRMMAFPQTVLWYAVFVLAIYGFFRLIVEKPRVAVLLGILLTVGISVNAMAEGNIGSAFRHRDFYAPIFIVLASAMLDSLMIRGGSRGSHNRNNHREKRWPR
jgi:4-amino-4-deoxy-L-arabinose transferase-like glycosyltransferase